MSDYYPIISQAVRGLETNSAETRRSLYDRARAALIENLTKSNTTAQDLNWHRSNLEFAIQRIEADEAKKELEANEPKSGLRHQLGVFSFLLGPRRGEPAVAQDRQKNGLVDRPAIEPTQILASQSLNIAEKSQG